VCLAAPIAWSLTEAFESLKEGWLVGAAVMTPVAVFTALLIYMVVKERRVRPIALLTAVAALGALGIALFPVFWFLLLGRY
jgi:uncharacterized membrane protein